MVSMLRRIRGKEVADKFFRRTLLQFKEAQINQICRRHGLNQKDTLQAKIEAIINSGVSYSSILKEEIYKPDTKLTEKNNLNVTKILVVAPEFSDDFVADCGDDFDLNISLIKASSLTAIYKACKENAGKKVTVQMLMKDVLVQEDRIIRALKK